jgi:hypothetical protein
MQEQAPFMAIKFSILLLPVLALIVLAVIWAAKSRTGRWVVGSAAGLFFLLLVAVFYLRTGSVQRFGPPRQIRVEDSFQAWQNESQVVKPVSISKVAEAPGGAATLEITASSAPRPDWVDTAGHSSVLTGMIGNAQFQLRQPGPNGELVGYSGLEPTPDAAIDAARKSLREQLRALVEWELAKNGRLGETETGPARPIEEVMAAIPGQEEPFRETVLTPVTNQTMYRAAVKTRVPTNPSWAAQQATAVLEQVRKAHADLGEQRVKGAWTGFGAGVLALVIFILYAFLNAGTKGHLAWPLRIVSVAAFLVLCWALLVIRGQW